MFRLIRQVSVIFVLKKKSFKYFLNPERKYLERFTYTKDQ